MLFLIRARCPPLSSGWPSSQATCYFLPALFSPILSLRITWRHPAQSHRGLRTPSPTRWALGQASLPFLNWSGGICAHPLRAVASSDPQPFRTLSLPFCSSCWNRYPSFLPLPGHSGPQLFDQVMVPFSPRAASAETVVETGTIHC